MVNAISNNKNIVIAPTTKTANVISRSKETNVISTQKQVVIVKSNRGQKGQDGTNTDVLLPRIEALELNAVSTLNTNW